MQMNFTVIIPHKNLPLLLERLLKSIPERDDLEIIVVDDHSDKDVVNFDCFPGKCRKNFLLLSNEGERGAGHARNYALPYARGRWVLFADSDDFFNSGFDAFLNDYMNCDADIVYFNANSVDTETYAPSDRADHVHDFFCEYNKNQKKGELIMRHMFTEPWCKMIKRNLIESYSISFDDTTIHEDVKFACMIGLYATAVIIDSRQLYCVTSRLGSLSRTHTHESYLDELRVFAWWKKYLVDNHIPLELKKFDYRLYVFTRNMYKNNLLFREEYNILRQAGFGRAYIIGQILKYLWKSIGYKFKIG
jgi:glycosyltransferase involved in cell wall biosynthesis